MGKHGQATPPSVSDSDDFTLRLCARVRDLRKERGWSLESLSAACGVSRSMLSQIERGEANPTVAVARRIAQAFSLSVGELIDESSIRSRIEVIPADDPAYLFRSDSKCRIRTLSPLHMEKDVEIYELRLQPGAALTSAAHFKGAREFITVLSGTIAVVSDADRSVLKNGASAYYHADVPHSIENAGRKESRAILMVTYA